MCSKYQLRKYHRADGIQDRTIDQKRSSYFALPGEIHNEIMKFLIVPGEIHLETPDAEGDSTVWKDPGVTFMATCRRARHEGREMFYGQNFFYLP